MDGTTGAERPPHTPDRPRARASVFSPWLALPLALVGILAIVVTLAWPEATLPARIDPWQPAALVCAGIALLLLLWVIIHAVRQHQADALGERRDLRTANAALVAQVGRQQAALDRLAQSERKYREIYETAMEGMFTTDISGRFLSANPALLTMIGYDNEAQLKAEVVDATVSFYVDQENREAITQSLLAQEEVGSMPVELRHRDGSHFWVAISARIIRNEDGRAVAFQGSVRDITQWRRDRLAMEQALSAAEMANRAKSEFLANMTHELRTPLNAIIGFSEIIATQAMGPIGQPAYREYAHDIHDSGQMLLTLINDILDLSRIQAGKKELSEKLVDVPRLIRSSMRLVAERADKGGVLLETEMEAELPPVRADEVALKQILNNLLSNAVKFTPDGGKVVCGARVEEDGALSLYVRDTGIGMREEDMTTAMEPFRQIEGSHSRSAGGVGLGLPLVLALARLHGGDARLESRLEHGTLVTVTLPPTRVQAMPLAFLRSVAPV
ncbi:PAS domain-containing sensor histidine kinase [Niveispirillum sp. KHB5.9]|uniref:PAS domain-containing sensor histidine kinase n=1 Tax=Niveispirillum sp. KHB5.9 TaxID=3400269 RepID=UPI003A8B7973